MEKGNPEYKKGLWTAEEDEILLDYVKIHGKGHWNSISKRTGLQRCGKSCRLRWMNYLNPAIKRGHFTEEEEDLIIRLHRLLGNRWSLIAGRVPGRTDNQVKNYWNIHLSKKLGIKKEARKIGGRVTTTNNQENSSPADSEANRNICSSDFDQTPVHFDSNQQNSPFWVSELDGLISESGANNPGCFMELMCGNSFNLDWNHF